MKKLVLGVLLMSGFASLSLTATNVTAADLKIGVVSVERILTEAPQVDAVNKIGRASCRERVLRLV